MKFAFEKLTADIDDRILEIIGKTKTEIASAVKEGIKNDLNINSASLLKGFKTEVSIFSSSIGSLLMTTPDRCS